MKIVDGKPQYSWGGGGGDEITYTCDCPDFQKFVDANPRSKFPSEKEKRSWEDSNAGAPTDCKHIMCVKLMERDGTLPESPANPEEPLIIAIPKLDSPKDSGKGNSFGFKAPKGVK